MTLLFVVALLSVTLALGACGSSGGGDAQPWLQDGSGTDSGSGAGGQEAGPGGAAPAGDAPITGSGDGLSGSGQWPAYIPADIPALDSNIRTVMEASTSLRVFYSGLLQEQVDDYLARLEQAGFQLTYVVYQDERYPDEEAAQERIDAGDFDAVNITKGDYRMTITYGGGDTTLDIETSAFADVYPYTPERDWPPELLGVIPSPDACRIEAVYAQDEGGYQIVCTPERPDAVDAYVMALLAMGFTPVRTGNPTEVDVASEYPDVYALGDWELTIGYPPAVSTMRITIWPADMTGGPAWPAELEGLIPPPEGCSLIMVQEWSELDYMITCTGQGDQPVADYVGRLVAAGFTDIGRTEMESGQMVSAVLQKDPFTVQLSLGAMNQLTVKITNEDISFPDQP